MRDLFVERKPTENLSRTFAAKLNPCDFIEAETKKAAENRLRRQPLDTPHIRAKDVNVARRLANIKFNLRLAPIRAFAWEGCAPHDSDPFWPLLYSRALDEAKWSASNANAAEIEIVATALAAEWLHAEAPHHHG